MLQKSKSNKMNVFKYVLILPVLALFLMSFNTKTIYIEADEHSKEIENSFGEIIALVITKNSTDTDLENTKKELEKAGLTVKFKGIKRNKDGEITAIKIDASTEKTSSNYATSSDEAIDPIKIIFNSENNSISIGNGNSKHGKNHFVFESKDGEHVIHESSGNNVFVFSSEDDEHNEDGEHEARIIIKKDGKKGKVKTFKKTKTVHIVTEGDGNNEDIEIHIDGDGDNKTIKTEKIIMKSGNGKNVWISDDKDNNEEDVIILKKSNHNKNVFVSTFEGGEPLVIIDGKEVPHEEMEKLNPDDIATIDVIKGDKAIKEHGDKAKDGVIKIVTKKKN